MYVREPNGEPASSMQGMKIGSNLNERSGSHQQSHLQPYSAAQDGVEAGLEHRGFPMNPLSYF